MKVRGRILTPLLSLAIAGATFTHLPTVSGAQTAHYLSRISVSAEHSVETRDDSDNDEDHWANGKIEGRRASDGVTLSTARGSVNGRVGYASATAYAIAYSRKRGGTEWLDGGRASTQNRITAGSWFHLSASGHGNERAKIDISLASDVTGTAVHHQLPRDEAAWTYSAEAWLWVYCLVLCR